MLSKTVAIFDWFSGKQARCISKAGSFEIPLQSFAILPLLRIHHANMIQTVGNVWVDARQGLALLIQLLEMIFKTASLLALKLSSLLRASMTELHRGKDTADVSQC